MTRTVRSCSHRLWIWYGQSDPPAIIAIAEEGLERTKASGLSHTLHISCSTYSNTAVMSLLRHGVRKQKGQMYRWKQKGRDVREYVRARKERERERHYHVKALKANTPAFKGYNPPLHHDITASLHSQSDNTQPPGGFTVGKWSVLQALDFTIKVIAFKRP